MRFSFLLFYVCNVNYWCSGIRLNPLENNDKLQDISNEYVAEWQWESWPIKQDTTEQNARAPGARVNVALWKDGSGSTWYLFGGQPVDTESRKIYSDVWKYSVTTRIWERFFPAQSENKGANSAKIGGMMTLRASLFDEGQSLSSEPKYHNVVLCGGITKINITKTKLESIWNFTRRKKQEEVKTELKYLAVYAPKKSKSNTVWQIDTKDKVWTAYVCCCDTINIERKNSTMKPFKPMENLNKLKTQISDKVAKSNLEKNGKLTKVNNTGEKKDEQKKIPRESIVEGKTKNNYENKRTETADKKSPNVEKAVDKIQEDGNLKVTVSSAETKNETANNGSVKVNSLSKKEKYNLKLKKAGNKTNVSDAGIGEKSKFCPEFSEDVEPVTWCDGGNEIIAAATVKTPRISLWIFNLTTSKWTQQQVKVAEGVSWPGCSESSPIRYAGMEKEVFIVCSPRPRETDSFSEINSTNAYGKLSDNMTGQSVYRINYETLELDSLGEIQLNPFFGSPEGQAIWQSDVKSILKAIRLSQNNTILLLSYLDAIDMWILSKTGEGKACFSEIEKIWRGSALKWFNKYNAALYNFQFVSDSGVPETILLENPRLIGPSEYWPRDRGRFIIRVFKNENLKNRSFENRTREQNLTYELLQSDFKPSPGEIQFDPSYSFKVLVFFGISLAIFAIFGFVVFIKRCVTCPPRIRARNECHKSPLVIRYSVIPDDLLYPSA